jgi:proteic killer suppression protein
VPYQVIASCRDQRTRDFTAGKWVRAFSGIERSARLRLDRLEAATELSDLAALRGNRLEALGGDRKGQYSIRINNGESVWSGRTERRDPRNVEIVDYH